MTDQLELSPRDGLAEREHALFESATRFAGEAKSPATRRAYARDWAAFEAWCAEHRREALPASPETVTLYLVHLAESDYKVATQERALASIGAAHRMAGEPHPGKDGRVSLVFDGIKRKHGRAQDQARPISEEMLRSLLEALRAEEAEAPLKAKRDGALLLIGWKAALRRSELVALQVEDLRFEPEGLALRLRRSKTDQEARGELVGIPLGRFPMTCAVRATRRWLEAGGVEEGALFRAVDRHGNVGEKALSDRAVDLIVKRTAELAELPREGISAHSLRAGFVTSAARRGIASYAIMEQSRHRSEAVMRGYIREGSLFSKIFEKLNV